MEYDKDLALKISEDGHEKLEELTEIVEDSLKTTGRLGHRKVLVTGHGLISAMPYIPNEDISEIDGSNLGMFSSTAYIEPYLFSNPYAETIDSCHEWEYRQLTKKHREANVQPIRTTPKIGRNEICPCGSGKKYKNCCLNKKNENI